MLPQPMNGGWLRPLLRNLLGTLLLGCPLFIASLRCEAQNLVPNPSFEIIDSCPQWPTLFGYQAGGTPQNWFSFSETPDYFNACVDSLTDVPVNVFGFQQAFDGQAYSGMWTYLTGDHREMAGTALLTPLTIGETYYVSFWANAAYGGNQPMDMGSSHLGALFTMDPYVWVYPMPEFALRNYAQVYRTEVLTDTLEWTLVSGSFVADSAYQYMVLGNHFADNYTDTTQIGPGFWGWAYSFVDMVCVSTSPTECPLATGIRDSAPEEGALYPNPVSDELELRFGEPYQGEVLVQDLMGRVVWQGRADGSGRSSIDVALWARGHYVVQWNVAAGRRSLPFVVVE